MIKKVTFIALLLLPLAAIAQKSELGIAAGIRTDGGATGSLAYYLKLWRIQVGAVAEVSDVRAITTLSSNDNYLVFAPGININFIVPFPRGYFYPGIAARYTTGKDDNMSRLKGTEYGVHAGVVLKIVKSLSASAEAGFRLHNAKVDYMQVGFNNSGSIPSTTVPYGASIGYVNIPMTLGLRWAF